MATVAYAGMEINLGPRGDAWYIQFARALVFNTANGARKEQLRDVWWRLSPLGSPPPSSLALGVGIFLAGLLGKIAEDNE